jgi:hypothetical protein
VSFVATSDQRLVTDIEKLIKTKIEIEPMVYDEDQPRISEHGRINDGRRMYREGQEEGGRESRREPRETRERREYTPTRQPTQSRDPFFSQPYESKPTASDTPPAWDSAAKTAPARNGVSANIKARKKIAALFKPAEV